LVEFKNLIIIFFNIIKVIDNKIINRKIFDNKFILNPISPKRDENKKEFIPMIKDE
jgi:hypothetical protein